MRRFHDLCNGDVLNPDKLGFQRRFAVFQKHSDYIAQVVVDFTAVLARIWTELAENYFCYPGTCRQQCVDDRDLFVVR